MLKLQVLHDYSYLLATFVSFKSAVTVSEQPARKLFTMLQQETLSVPAT